MTRNGWVSLERQKPTVDLTACWFPVENGWGYRVCGYTCSERSRLLNDETPASRPGFVEAPRDSRTSLQESSYKTLARCAAPLANGSGLLGHLREIGECR